MADYDNGMAGRVLEALQGVVDAWCEFKVWRDDWRRTWSPASYVLAFVMFVGVVVLLYLYGQQAWDWTIAQWAVGR